MKNLIDISSELIEKEKQVRAPESILPVSIYDIKISSADGKKNDILAGQKGKVTLLFNVAAGCGNIPQHGNLETLNQLYKDNSDFSIIAVVVDDFTCHGYPEFQKGLKNYIEENNLSLTPGEVAKDYAEKNFGTTFEFTELTNGRHDKHRYDNDYAPGSVKEQDQHPLWAYLTGAYAADLQDSGVPFHNEEVPWSNAPKVDVDNKNVFYPITGNFTKFLIDKTGTKVKRYANGFMLGERNIFGETFSWYPEKYTEDGRRDHNPIIEDREDFPNGGPYPTPLQRLGIDVSIDILRRDIEEYLSE